MKNSDDGLIHQSDEDLKQDMTKFIPRKAVKYKETAIGWNTRCSKNVHECRRVKEGDTIEIFYPEVRLWKPYTLLQIHSAKILCHLLAVRDGKTSQP